MAIQIGRYNELVVMRDAPPGVYLSREGDDEEVLLPTRLVPEGTRLGDELRVFVYTDSEDRPVATTQRPKAVVGDFALLRVVDVSEHGAFLDWGLDKDLFAPFGEQRGRLSVGDQRVFAVTLDEHTGRVMASSQLHGHIDYDVSGVSAGDEVELLVYGRNEVGTLVLVDERHTGIVYHNEAFSPMRAGDRLIGFVHLVRPDNKLDIRLQRKGKEAIDDARQVLLHALRDAGGFLPLHDKSDPGAIRRELEMSKKAFKKALGGLYKERLVELRPDGVQLLAEPPGPSSRRR